MCARRCQLQNAEQRADKTHPAHSVVEFAYFSNYLSDNFMLRIGEEDFLELGHLYNEFRVRRLKANRAFRREIILCYTTNFRSFFDVSIFNFIIFFSLLCKVCKFVIKIRVCCLLFFYIALLINFIKPVMAQY